MGRLDAKLGLGVGCLVGCQVWAEIFGLRSECLFLDLVLRSDSEIRAVGALRSGPKICILPRPYLFGNFLTPERKNFVVTPKIELPKGLALMLWFRWMQFVFEELISITRATIYCDEFKLYKVCVNRERKNALTSLPQTHAACFQKFPNLRNFNEPCDHLMNINEPQ